MYLQKKWKYLNIYNKDRWDLPGRVNSREVHKPSYMINFSWRQEHINTKWIVCSTVRSKFLLLVPDTRGRKKKDIFSRNCVRSHSIKFKWMNIDWQRIVNTVILHFIKSTINEKQWLTDKKRCKYYLCIKIIFSHMHLELCMKKTNSIPSASLHLK
jgi:hypothetical protein